MATKRKEHENLTHSAIQKVIALLNPQDTAQKPISKKEACAILNISYNTTRLSNIIEEFQRIRAYAADRRAQNRGKPASAEELQLAAAEYLKGTPISSIANQLFRSTGFVKSLIDRLGVPSRDDESGLLPEQCVSEFFSEGELAWSATYKTVVKVKKELTEDYQKAKKGMSFTDYEAKYGSKAYQIYILEDVNSEDSFFPGIYSGGFAGYALASELGSLRHLKELGIDLEKI